MMATCAFACRYRLESVLSDVEARIQAEPRATLGGLEEATTYAASLPASSADVGLASLMRVLHTTSSTVRPAAATQDTLREYCRVLRNCIGSCYSGHMKNVDGAWQALIELEKLVNA